MPFDTSFYYRLTNNFLGPSQSLDVIPDGSCRLRMFQTGDYSGQFWKLTALSGGRYGLHTAYLGDCFSLDVINDGVNKTPWLAATGDYSGQYWTLSQWADGTYKLTNAFTGSGKSLDVYSNTHEPFMDTGDHSGQHWTLTRLRAIPSNRAIPPLDPRGNTNMSEGPTDHSLYANASGTIRAVMVFVDFSNAPAGTTSASATADHLLGNGQFQELFRDHSYQRLILDVVVKSGLGWRRMPKPSTKYSFATYDSHRAYIADAAALFLPSEVKFSDYTFVYIVAPQNAGFPLSPAFPNRAGAGAPSPSGEIRLAVTLGTDSYTNRYINLVHETGHLFGLPDLYPVGGGGGAGNSLAGCWSLMSDIFHSVSFLGWDRYKNEWLSLPRVHYLTEETIPWYTTLSPMRGNCGLSMIVMPIDDPVRPSKVAVVELAQPVLGTNNRSWGEGVLLYTVDAMVPSGSSPLAVIPKTTSTSPDYGYLYQAPYGVGDSKSVTIGRASIQLQVLQKFASSYNIKLAYHIT